jgi:CDGSH-type Zn-finger protein/uncharacterized Fe-S cluster protein YjdI
MDRRYTGDALDITYNIRRCIHAEECIDRLSAVFDRDSRPWIHTNGAPADQIAEVVMTCPSGALHVHRKDGGTPELAPQENTVLLWEDGPLQFHGALSITGEQVDVQEETRATLCRCGESTHKPFCDNSHRKTGFHSEDNVRKSGQELDGASSRAVITVEPNGPYEVSGSLRIFNHKGDLLFVGDQVKLCRCGYSGTRPFCDGTHLKINFQAE